MTARDEQVTTVRLPGGHVVLLINVDLTALDHRQLRALARLRTALADLQGPPSVEPGLAPLADVPIPAPVSARQHAHSPPAGPKASEFRNRRSGRCPP